MLTLRPERCKLLQAEQDLRQLEWRTELARRDKARGSGAQERALTFVPLTVHVPAVQRGELEVVLIGDRRIRIVDDFEPAILAKLVTVLEQLPC